MQPEIDLLGLPLKTFGIMFALGFLASGAVIQRRMKELRIPADWAYEMIFSALVGGLVGARLYWVDRELSASSDDLLGNLLGGTGLVWYGGVLGGALLVVLWARLARLARPDAARRRGGAAGARLRDRPDRLPALGRRRLRQGLGRAVGDGLSARDGPDDRGDGAPDADLRDARDGARRLVPVDAARPRRARASSSRSTSSSPGWSGSWSSSCAATRPRRSGSRCRSCRASP